VFSLAGIFRRFWPGYRAKFRQAIPAAHVRAAEAILRCRTPEAGMVYYRCGGCGKVEPHPVSCGHRACNACGQHKSKEWEARQKSRLLPVPYHMVTFTVPSEFRDVFRRHPKLCYSLLFRESAGALTDLAADPRHLGGELGLTGILQTWTRDLRYHPHIHYLVPGGALTKTGWVRPRHPNILVPAKPLAVRMRNRFRTALKTADFKLYLSLPHKAWQKPWNADAREVGSGARAFEYVARYVQKTALDASRITAVDGDGDGVSFCWTDRESGKEQFTTLSGEEFLRRFLQHVLPRGFTRVRHYGWLSPAARERYARVRHLLRAGDVVLPVPDKADVLCPCCGHAMTFFHALRTRARPPPGAPTYAITS
jgi:hypothetical protein